MKSLYLLLLIIFVLFTSECITYTIEDPIPMKYHFVVTDNLNITYINSLTYENKTSYYIFNSPYPFIEEGDRIAYPEPFRLNISSRYSSLIFTIRDAEGKIIYRSSCPSSPTSGLTIYYPDGNIAKQVSCLFFEEFEPGPVGQYNVVWSEDILKSGYLSRQSKPYWDGSKWTIPTCLGDVNKDGVVNIVDFASVGSAFGSSVGDPNYNVNADLDESGYINIVDLSLVGTNFGICP